MNAASVPSAALGCDDIDHGIATRPTFTILSQPSPLPPTAGLRLGCPHHAARRGAATRARASANPVNRVKHFEICLQNRTLLKLLDLKIQPTLLAQRPIAAV